MVSKIAPNLRKKPKTRRPEVSNEEEQTRLSTEKPLNFAPGLDGRTAPEPANLTPANILALQQTIGNKAVQRLLNKKNFPKTHDQSLIQRVPEILYPRHKEVIQSSEYTIKMKGDPDTNNMRVRIGNAGNAYLQTRSADGYYWFDWAGYGLGDHRITAEAYNAAGVRQETQVYQVRVVADKKVNNIIVGAVSFPNRMELPITLQFADGTQDVITMHCSQYRHLVDEYFQNAQDTKQPPITTLTRATRPQFAAAFLEYAHLLLPHLKHYGVSFRPINDEYNLNTSQNISFHSDFLNIQGKEIHCFPTDLGALSTTVPVDQYVEFKHLARLYAYLNGAEPIPWTAVTRAQDSLALAGVSWCVDILNRFGIGNYADQVLTPAATRSKNELIAKGAANKAKATAIKKI